MTEFKPGDIVRLTKGEPDKPGYQGWVREVTSGILSTGKKVSLSKLREFEALGWVAELIERPAPPLPTKPNTLGWATVDGVRSLARLGVCGLWETYGSDGALGAKPHPSTIEDFEEAVLIPKELADRITAWPETRGELATVLVADLAAHLKGQNDE